MMNKYIKPELISPAGDWPSLQSAISSGADGVYFGVKKLNMRAAAVNFETLEIKKVMALLHQAGKKGYLVLNTIVYQRELPELKKIIKEAKKSRVDAIMAWDMAVIRMAQEEGLKTHLSTQASVSNFEAVKFYVSLGVKRIVLARECSLAEIKEIIQKIKKHKLNCEIEVFIHGAMCVSISGRCLLSQDLYLKSANRGECIHPCRRQYLIQDVETGAQVEIGQGYILSAKDLCVIDFIDKLIEAGITAFKIEGRMRPPEYISVVTATYREAIDAYFADKFSPELKKSLKERLKTVYNREFSPGFYLGVPQDTGSTQGLSQQDKIFLGQVRKFYNRINVLEIVLRNEGIKIGDELLVFGKTTPATMVVINELQIAHQPVNSASKGDIVGVRIPFKARPKDKVFLRREKINSL